MFGQNKGQLNCPAGAERAAQLVARHIPSRSPTQETEVETMQLIGKVPDLPSELIQQSVNVQPWDYWRYACVLHPNHSVRSKQLPGPRGMFRRRSNFTGINDRCDEVKLNLRIFWFGSVLCQICMQELLTCRSILHFTDHFVERSRPLRSIRDLNSARLHLAQKGMLRKTKGTEIAKKKGPSRLKKGKPDCLLVKHCRYVGRFIEQENGVWSVFPPRAAQLQPGIVAVPLAKKYQGVPVSATDILVSIID